MWIAAAIAWLGCSLAGARVLPGWLAPLFDGPDGTRWVSWLVAWMGVVGTAYLLWASRYFPRARNVEVLVASAVASFFTGLMVFVAIQRLGSGLRLLESFNAVMAARFAAGASLYPDPELAPTGTVYPPLYYLVCALFYKALPGSLGYGRLVSLAATLGTCGVLYRVVIRLRGDRMSALWGVCLFLATYAMLHHLYDQVSVDPLLMFLTLAALYFLLGDTPRSDSLALLMIGIACFTKQTAALQFLVVLGCMIVSRRRLWTYWPVVFAAACGTLLLAATRGTAWLYLVAYLSRHGWQGMPFGREMVCLAARQLPILIGVAWFLRGRSNARFWVFAGSVFVSSLSGLLHAGGWVNVLIPLEPILCAAAAPYLRQRRLLLAAQLVFGLYNPFATLYPFSTIREVDNLAIDLSQTVDGEVWFPAESDLAYRAGKTEWDNLIAVGNITWAKQGPPQRLLDAIRTQRFKLILVRGSHVGYFDRLHPALLEAVGTYYFRRKQYGLAIFTPRINR